MCDNLFLAPLIKIKFFFIIVIMIMVIVVVVVVVVIVLIITAVAGIVASAANYKINQMSIVAKYCG